MLQFGMRSTPLTFQDQCFECVFPTCGAHPHYAVVRSVPSGFEACDLASLPPPPPPHPPDFALYEPVPGGLQGRLQLMSDIETHNKIEHAAKSLQCEEANQREKRQK